MLNHIFLLLVSSSVLHITIPFPVLLYLCTYFCLCPLSFSHLICFISSFSSVSPPVGFRNYAIVQADMNCMTLSLLHPPLVSSVPPILFCLIFFRYHFFLLFFNTFFLPIFLSFSAPFSLHHPLSFSLFFSSLFFLSLLPFFSQSPFFSLLSHTSLIYLTLTVFFHSSFYFTTLLPFLSTSRRGLKCVGFISIVYCNPLDLPSC